MSNSTGGFWSALTPVPIFLFSTLLLVLFLACICFVAIWCVQLLDCLFRNERFEFSDSRLSISSFALILATLLVYFGLNEKYLLEVEGQNPGQVLASFWYSFIYTILFLAICLGAGLAAFGVFEYVVPSVTHLGAVIVRYCNRSPKEETKILTADVELGEAPRNIADDQGEATNDADPKD